jgi:hypothetical protein
VRKSLFFFIALCILASCSNDKPGTTATDPNSPANESNASNNSPIEHNKGTSINDGALDYDQQMIKERMRGKERKGPLDIEHIKVVGVEGELLESMMQYLKAVKEDNEDKAKEILYSAITDTSNGLTLYSNRQYTKAITKLTLDNTRGKAVSDENSLSQIADEVAIVVVDTLSTTDEKGNINFIFIKAKGKWSLYKTD